MKNQSTAKASTVILNRRLISRFINRRGDNSVQLKLLGDALGTTLTADAARYPGWKQLLAGRVIPQKLYDHLCEIREASRDTEATQLDRRSAKQVLRDGFLAKYSEYEALADACGYTLWMFNGSTLHVKIKLEDNTLLDWWPTTGSWIGVARNSGRGCVLGFEELLMVAAGLAKGHNTRLPLDQEYYDIVAGEPRFAEYRPSWRQLQN